MAVFTPVSAAQLQPFLDRQGLGALQRLTPIESGIENTNYFVDTARGHFVLTLFERLPAGELPFYLGLMRHLAAAGLPCPDPVPLQDGQLHGELAGRPAALVSRLTGRSVLEPDEAQCAALGACLARMHLAARDYAPVIANPRGLDWCRDTARRLLPRLDAERAALLRDECAFQESAALSASAKNLPGSAIHADLFRDNVLLEGAHVRGIIDFYFAGHDRWLYDLAVTCNDWCLASDDSLDPGRLGALLHAYAGLRPLTADERIAWPAELRRAALRFWLSRLQDQLEPRPATLIHPKDPGHFERLLRARRAYAPALA